MVETPAVLDWIINREYEHGFVSDVHADALPPGLSEHVIRAISAKKGEPPFMLEWRLAAYRHWLTLAEPTWGSIEHAQVNYQDIVYYSAPKSPSDRPKSA